MSRKTRKRSSAKPVELILPGFEANERRRIGASDSAHEVAFGRYKGKEVAVKPFRSKSGRNYAEREAKVTKEVMKHGFRTFEPLEVLNLRRFKVALLVSRYVPDLAGANTMSLEADPDSLEGKLVQARVGRMSDLLGRLHAQRITHGDPLAKNFAFATPWAGDPGAGEPYVYDFEKGASHPSGSRDFPRDVVTDIDKLMYSLGSRQFGGAAAGDAAAEFAREAVILPYLASPVSEELSGLALGQIIDAGQASFTAGRENKRLPEPRPLALAA